MKAMTERRPPNLGGFCAPCGRFNTPTTPSTAKMSGKIPK